MATTINHWLCDDGRTATANPDTLRNQRFELHDDWTLDHEEVRGAAFSNPDASAVEIVGTGGGWYELRVAGETVERVQGKEAAETRSAELAEEIAPESSGDDQPTGESTDESTDESSDDGESDGTEDGSD